MEFQDITAEIGKIVEGSRTASGVCYLYVPHTTAAVIVNEHADPSVVRDIIDHLETMVPERGPYRHAEGNSPAHIKASLLGITEVLLIENGKLALGTWQGVFFCEFDGPRSRSLYIKIVPDAP